MKVDLELEVRTSAVLQGGEHTDEVVQGSIWDEEEPVLFRVGDLPVLALFEPHRDDVDAQAIFFEDLDV